MFRETKTPPRGWVKNRSTKVSRNQFLSYWVKRQLFKNSYQEVFCKNTALNNFVKFKEKSLRLSPFSLKHLIYACNFTKQRSFEVTFLSILRNFPKNLFPEHL